MNDIQKIKRDGKPVKWGEPPLEGREYHREPPLETVFVTGKHEHTCPRCRAIIQIVVIPTTKRPKPAPAQCAEDREESPHELTSDSQPNDRARRDQTDRMVPKWPPESR